MATFTGINHLAMVTKDMDATVRFWRDLLGMRLVVGLGHPGYRHYFFEISGQDMIAFFEWPHAESIPEKDHGVPVRGPVAFDHISFGVASKDDLWELKALFEANEIWASEVIDHGFILSVYAFDPNNIPVEFSYAVPEHDLRMEPRLIDSHPTAITLEGSRPTLSAWKRPVILPEDRTVYPGEADTILETPNKFKTE